MPGEELATAAILSPRPIAWSALLALGLVLTPAPISPRWGAASNTSAAMPKAASACAAASPASPPPTMAIGRPGVMERLLIQRIQVAWQRRQTQRVAPGDLNRGGLPLRMMGDRVEIAPMPLDRVIAQNRVRPAQIEQPVDRALQQLQHHRHIAPVAHGI